MLMTIQIEKEGCILSYVQQSRSTLASVVDHGHLPPASLKVTRAYTDKSAQSAQMQKSQSVPKQYVSSIGLMVACRGKGFLVAWKH